MDQYEICLGKEVVGHAYVSRQGLYYCFRCSCELQSEIICRVTVSCGGHHENLGILVPEGNRYKLTKKIPVKRLGQGIFQFQITPKHQKTYGKYISVYPEEPFRYIQKLQNAYLQHRGGSTGIVIQE